MGRNTTIDGLDNATARASFHRRCWEKNYRPPHGTRDCEAGEKQRPWWTMRHQFCATIMFVAYLSEHMISEYHHSCCEALSSTIIRKRGLPTSNRP